MREEVLQKISLFRVVAIARGIPEERILPLAQALYDGGIRLIEVTYDHSDPDSFSVTDSAIRALKREFSARMKIGAGTVISMECLNRARDAGAEFIISPDVNPVIISETRKMGLVSVPGALTPTEILTAVRAGADIVKLFPAGDMGLSYFKSVRAPLKHVPFMAVGGITPENAAEFLLAGAVGLGVSSFLTNRMYIENGEFEKITQAARTLLSACGQERV